MSDRELPTGDKDLTQAYDGSCALPTRELQPLERELVVRLIDDVNTQLRLNNGRLESLTFETSWPSTRAHGIRLYDQDEYNMLVNIRNVIDPRRDIDERL
jgi:hypothetical protein